MIKALFISPHPDDECLSMGMGIQNHIWYGYDVYIALLTHGGGSDAINIINGSGYCDWHKFYHNPQLENYSLLSNEQFQNERINEFKYSSACLGVKPQNILIYDYRDGNVSKDMVKKVIRDFLTRYPGALIKAPSYLDIHHDHSACGYALLELYNSREVMDARFYVSPGQWDNTPGAYEENMNCTTFLRASIAVYKRWNPGKSMYGIGYHSVQPLFDIVSAGMKSKYHSPNEF